MWSYEWLKEHYHEFKELKDAPEEDALTPEEVEYYMSKKFESDVKNINEELLKDFDKKDDEYLKENK